MSITRLVCFQSNPASLSQGGPLYSGTDCGISRRLPIIHLLPTLVSLCLPSDARYSTMDDGVIFSSHLPSGGSCAGPWMAFRGPHLCPHGHPRFCRYDLPAGCGRFRPCSLLGYRLTSHRPPCRFACGSPLLSKVSTTVIYHLFIVEIHCI